MDQAEVEKELLLLERMGTGDLRRKYAEVFGVEPTSRNRIYLMRKLAWKIQANAFGGLSERALRRAEELADFSDIRTTPPGPPKALKRTACLPNRTAPVRNVQPRAILQRDPRLPLPGTVLQRAYEGWLILVTVLQKGFQYEGKAYRSLSAIARAVTGTSWNGFDFFHLGRRDYAAQ